VHCAEGSAQSAWRSMPNLPDAVKAQKGEGEDFLSLALPTFRIDAASASAP